MSNDSRPRSPKWIRSAASAAHQVAASTVLTSRLYLGFWRLVAGNLSPHRRAQLLNSLRAARWPAEALTAQSVSLGGQTEIRLLPHNEELDFEAVLSGTLSHEPEVFRFLDSRLGQYDAVIEIGANVGVFTLYLAKRMQEQGGSGKIFSFEPSRKAYARLVQNIELNQANNVLAFNCAIGRRSEIVNFYEPVGHLMNGSLNAEFAAGFSSQVKMVPVIVLDAQIILALITRPSRVLIKIDTEGAEAVIILALSKIITQLQPDLLVEVLPEFEGAIREAIEKVAPGYESFAITKEGTCRQAAISSHALRDCFLTPSTVKLG